MTVSNLTLEEYIRVNRDSIPSQLLALIDDATDELGYAEDREKKKDKEIELLWEQIDFAKDLIEGIDNWATELPKTKQASYKVIRDNTQFET